MRSCSAALQGGILLSRVCSPEQFAEKVNSKPLLVAQALLPVLVLLPSLSMHSQEWLCYPTFSATCEGRRYTDHTGFPRRVKNSGYLLRHQTDTPASKSAPGNRNWVLSRTQLN